MKTETQRKTPYDYRRRVWGEVAAGQGMPRSTAATRIWKRQESILARFSEGMWP